MYYVYILKSAIKNWTYIGCTDDLKKRFVEHQLGKTKSTKAYKPFSLFYYEAYSNKTHARKREYQLKHHNQSKELLYEQIGLSPKLN